MLPGVMTSSELRQASGATGMFGRVRFETRITRYLNRAHETGVGHSEYAQRVLDLLEECNEWVARHPGVEYSRRRQAIQKLQQQLAPLAVPILSARASIRADMQARRKGFERTGQMSELARVDHIALGRGPGENSDPRTMKGRAGFRQDLLAATVDRATRLKHDPADLNVEQIGFLAARTALKVDTVLDEKARQRCQVEAMRVLCALLGKNRELATAFARGGVEVVVVPADRPMTDLIEFSSLKGVDITQGSAPSGRTWDETRGVGGLLVGGTV